MHWKGVARMVIKKDLAHRNNYGSARDVSVIKYLVIHYTGNDGDTDEANANYFNAYRGVSAHYFVDDDSVTQSVPDEHEAWAVGGAKYPSCHQTGGGKFYNKCVNRNSISVELCDTKRDGKYGFTEKTLANAAELCRMLIEKYNIKPENIIRHFDVNGKNCPAPFVSDVKAWEAFKERIVNEVKYYEKLSEIPKWAQPMIKEMIDKGCFGDKNALHLSDDMIRVIALMERKNK